jgi:CheY-like chemotaxis protein
METSSQHRVQNLTSLNVLLVEDDSMNQFIAKTFLTKWGLTVAIANNGREAVDMVQAKGFQIVLMDIHMPEMDGGEATRRIRAMADPYFKALPILAFSAVVESKEKANEMGMTDFTTKPINPSDLQSKINQYTNESAAQTACRKLNIDFDMYTDGDAGFKAELASLVVKNMYELEESILITYNENNTEHLYRILHKMKPTLAMLNDSEHAEVLGLLKEMNPTDTAYPEIISKFNIINRQIISALEEESRAGTPALALVSAKAA